MRTLCWLDYVTVKKQFQICDQFFTLNWKWGLFYLLWNQFWFMVKFYFFFRFKNKNIALRICLSPQKQKQKQKTTSMSSSNIRLLQDDLTRYRCLVVLDDMVQTNWKMKLLGKKHKVQGSGSDDWGQDARYSHAGRIGIARCDVFLIVPATCLPSTGLSLWPLLKCLLF